MAVKANDTDGLKKGTQRDKQTFNDINSSKKDSCTTWLGLTVISVIIGSSSQYGYHCGVINAPSEVMREFYNSSYFDRNQETLTENSLRWLWAITVSIYCIGGALGCIIGGYASEVIGRKRTLLANNVFSISASFLVTASQYLNVYELVIVARFLAGLNSGTTQTVAGLYLAEISPKNVRGLLLTGSPIGGNVGLILAQVLSFYVFNHNYDWGILLGLTPFILSIFQLVTLPFCPESPRWLLLCKKDKEGARRALHKLRANCDICDEIDEMYRESKFEDTTKVGVFDLMNPCNGRPEWRLPLVICLVLSIANGFCGVNMIWFYSSSILASAGLSPSQISFSTVIFGAVSLATAIIGAYLFDRFGRRPVMITSFITCGLFMAGFSLTSIFQGIAIWIPWASIVIIIVYIMFCNFGPGPAPYVVCPELWSQGPRSAAVSITMQTVWWSNFICGQAMPFMQAAIEGYTYLLFTSVLFISAIFFYLYIPETNNISFKETTDHFRRRSLGKNPDDLRISESKRIMPSNV